MKRIKDWALSRPERGLTLGILLGYIVATLAGVIL